MRNELYTTYLSEILTQLRLLRVDKEASVVLVGSHARNKQTWRSDMDFIVVTPERIRRWKVPLNVHIIFDTRNEFTDKLIHGNDFQQWAVRFGKLLMDYSGWWNTVKNSEGIDIWPDWRLKIRHAKKAQSIASQLLMDDDWDNAEEEFLLSASHIARALLLRNKIFPLSRPELAWQLKLIGQDDLSNVMERLICGTKTHEDLIEISKTICLILENLRLEAEESEESKSLAASYKKLTASVPV
ncbi:nucleotidyltransferase domain-containing protein [Candidatus Magnetominusculus dajiuhuensis]|uniref:nucleotidyltransferase domain-containing protein n=1 Tax=Candidatus Magnetominusculus dajiuhuensis TaxID=3137712 RepID=UPI003B428F91